MKEKNELSWEDFAKMLPNFRNSPSEFKKAYQSRVKNIIDNWNIEEKRTDANKSNGKESRKTNKSSSKRIGQYSSEQVKRLQSDFLRYSRKSITNEPKKLTLFIFKNEPLQTGNGYYSMTACFVTLDVHVPFTIYCHSENEYLELVGEPTTCNGLCNHRNGSLENYLVERKRDDFSLNEIVEKALSFYSKKK